MKEKLSKEVVDQRLSGKIRGAVVFASISTIKKGKITKQVMDSLHELVSSSMQQVFSQHVAQKSVDLIEALKDRELIYIDAAKKGDMDIFTYITQQYFNVCSEDIRLKYNKLEYGSNPEFFDAEPGVGDSHFLKKVEHYKTYPQRKEEGSDMLIGWMPLHNICMLMLYNRQQDLNIFLDNVHNITPQEMGILNNAIRAGLLVSSEQRIGLYINNMKDRRNFVEGAKSMPPQAGHDMKMIYI